MKAVYFLDNWNKDPRASRTVNDNAEEMASLNNNMAQCHQELQSMPLDLTETGGGLKFQAERPHLVSLGSGRLSTAVTLLPLAEGRTTLGHGSADIALQGPGVAAQHGYIENLSGRVTLHPCGNHCSVDGLSISRPVRLSQGCMLCFGQSCFFRFNHPQEAYRMKSMMPQGGKGVSTQDYQLHTDTESLVNGNHQPGPTYPPPAPSEREQSEHSAIVSSIEKDLQDIMDSLVMDDPPAPSSSGARGPPETGRSIAHSPLSPLLNGGGGYLLSPPTSPGAMSVGSSYENNSPPFSPLSSPSAASSGSFTSPSPSGGPQQVQSSTSLPPVPVRSSSYNHSPQAAPQPRTGLPSYSSGGSVAGQKVQESPRLQRKALLDAPPSPKLGRRSAGQDGHESPRQIRLLSSTESLTGHNVVPGSPRHTPKFPTCSSPSPTSPRTKVGMGLQERPSSPTRHLNSQPLRAFQPPLDPIIHIIQGSPGLQPLPQSPRSLQPLESPRMARRNAELNGGTCGSSLRELPPLSPSMARRGFPVLPGALPGTPSGLRTPDSPSALGKLVPGSPRLRHKTASTSDDPFGGRGFRTRSPSPTSMSPADGFSGGGGSLGSRKASFGSSLTPAYSLGSLPGSSPVASPRSHRKRSGGGRPHPGMRERKNSISEISDNEDELLDYHRRQREERLREQEMEKLERQRLETILNLCAEYNKGDDYDGPLEAPTAPGGSGMRAGVPTGDGSAHRGAASVGAGSTPAMALMTPMAPGSHLAYNGRPRAGREEENLREEESSSTESTHQEQEAPAGREELVYREEERLEVLSRVEDERLQVLSRVDELKARLTELEQQLQEARQEAEMERALLQGERQAELDQMEAESDVITQLQRKLDELENAVQREKDEERACVEVERAALQALQRGYTELQGLLLHQGPGARRDQLMEQLKREGEVLEASSKRFEDLEFQQLEKESSLEEERELVGQQLLHERADFHRSSARRK
ncbi:unnamed protein product, partial [Gadus morhua 'NCC']